MRTELRNAVSGIAPMFLAGMIATVPAEPAGGSTAEPAGAVGDVRDSRGQRLGPLTAALVQANRQAELEMRLVARLEVQPNEIFEIYEPAPGVLLLSGAGAPDGPLRVTPELARLPPEEVWSLVADGHPMPPRLQAAIENARQRRLGGPRALKNSRPPSGFGGGSAERGSGAAMTDGDRGVRPPSRPLAATSGWCDTGYFTTGWSNCVNDPLLPFQVCLDNWWHGAYAYHEDVWILNSNVCPAQGGPVAYWIRSDEDFGGLWTVSQNTVRWFNYYDVDCLFWALDDCPYIRADVINAHNKRFHFRYRAGIE